MNIEHRMLNVEVLMLENSHFSFLFFTSEFIIFIPKFREKLIHYSIFSVRYSLFFVNNLQINARNIFVQHIKILFNLFYVCELLLKNNTKIQFNKIINCMVFNTWIGSILIFQNISKSVIKINSKSQSC